MANNVKNNESVNYVANFNDLGVRVQVSAIDGGNSERSVQVDESHNSAPTPTGCVGAAIVAKVHGMSPTQRKEALRNAGVDVSKYFAMGETMLTRLNEKGEPEQVFDDDPIFQRISDEGYINVHKLFRRWVMAQMFNLMDGHKYWWSHPANLTEAIRRKGYEYTWKMTVNEFHAQVKMFENGDIENFRLRSMWFDRYLVLTMMNDYMEKLKKYIDGLRVKHCSKYQYQQPYKTIKGVHYFLDDLDARIYRPLNGAIKKLRDSLGDIKKTYKALKEFNDNRISLSWETEACEAWIQAYKGSGAFFTCDNLIKFHDCRAYRNGIRTGRNLSLEILNKSNLEYARSREGWRMIGFLKKLMEDNKISIDEKREEWAKAKRNRK